MYDYGHQYMIPLRERKKAETKKRIVATAMKTFAKKGIEAATVDEIAAAAEVGKGTIYNYFETKEDIIVAFLVDIENDVQAEVTEMIKRPRSLQAALTQYVLFQFKLKEPHHEFVQVFLAQMFSKASAASPWIQQIQTIIDPPLRVLFSSLQHRGLVRADIDVAVLIQLFKVVHLGLTALWAIEGPPWSGTETVVKQEIRLFCEGVGAR
jgi:AcrR family transcriptional regulator